MDITCNNIGLDFLSIFSSKIAKIVGFFLSNGKKKMIKGIVTQIEITVHITKGTWKQNENFLASDFFIYLLLHLKIIEKNNLQMKTYF